MSSAMNITAMLNDEQQRHHQHMSQPMNILPSSVRNFTGYPSPSEPSQPLSNPQGPYEHPPPFDGMYLDRRQSNGRPPPTSLRVDTNVAQPAQNDNSRTFPCGTCSKPFARRSDLARHERIHSNHRPHVCPEPNCNKQFIQRSALTVHLRVHTGEKPHLCERCGKPFSDSSSLARHRRIHSGRRPYQCPYADCQKTFTRRTTLTRHQNHHTGTIEEAAAATARTLASRGPDHRRRSSGSTNVSDITSGMSSIGTSSPSGMAFPPSPMTELPQIPPLDRHNGPPYGDPLPLHLRPGLQQPSPRSSPSAGSPSPSLFGMSRPSLTSHPHPQLPVLEPPAYQEMRSGSGSPHLSTPTGWQSPISNSMPSPMGSDSMGHYDQHPPPNVPLYLSHNNMRRPSSMEPDHLDLNRSRPEQGPPSHVWSGNM